MFSLIKQVFIVLFILSLFYSLAANCVSLKNEPGLNRSTVIDSNLVELNYYPLMTSLDKCNGSFNSVFDLSTKI